MKKLTVLFLAMVIIFSSVFVLPASAATTEPAWETLYSDFLTRYLYNRYKYGLDMNENDSAYYENYDFYQPKTAPFSFLYDFNFDGTPELVCGCEYDVFDLWDENGQIEKIYTIKDSKVVSMGTLRVASDPFATKSGVKRYFDMKTRKIRYFVSTKYYGTMCVNELKFDFSKKRVKKSVFANITALEDDQGTQATINGKKITSQSYYRQKISSLFNERFIKYNDLDETKISKKFYDTDSNKSEYIENGYDSIDKSIFEKYADDIISLYEPKIYTKTIKFNYSDNNRLYINSYLDSSCAGFYNGEIQIDERTYCNRSATSNDKVILFSGNNKILKRIDACRLKAVGIGKTKVTVYSPNNARKKTFEITVHPCVPTVKLVKATSSSLTFKTGSVQKGVEMKFEWVRSVTSGNTLLTTSGNKNITLKNLKSNQYYGFMTSIKYKIGDKVYTNNDYYSFKTKKRK